MSNSFKRLEIGKIGLVQETEDGRIIQIGLRPEQSDSLQQFLSLISQGKPLVQMGEDYELVLKSETHCMVDLNDEEQKTEHNTKVVSSFIEHCKGEGVSIPDKLFESYFNA